MFRLRGELGDAMTTATATVSLTAAQNSASEYHGTVRGFLLAAIVTQWGLLGSVVTVFLTLLELEHAGSLSPTPVILLAVTLLAAIYFFGRYSWVKIGGTLADQFDAANAAAARAAEMPAGASVAAEWQAMWKVSAGSRGSEA